MKKATFAKAMGFQTLILAAITALSAAAHAECTKTPIEGGYQTICQSSSGGDNVNTSNVNYNSNNPVYQQSGGSADLSQFDSLLHPTASSTSTAPVIPSYTSLFNW